MPGIGTGIGMRVNSADKVGISWSSYWMKLTFDDIANVPVADASSVSDWNTWFDLPTNGTSFTSVSVNGAIVTLSGGSNIKLKNYLFGDDACGEHLIEIEDSGCVTELGEGVFSDWNVGGGCYNLTKAISPSLIIMRYAAFSDCISLPSYVMADSVTSFDESAFYGCTSLSNINIPDGITNIGMYSFRYCSALTSITVPSSVISIGTNAFNNATSLATINMYPLVAPTVNLTTSFGDYAATLHIQAGSTGYDVAPWTNLAKFALIVQDL